MRRVRTILVFLLLGVVVNVAVAWGLIAFRNSIPINSVAMVWPTKYEGQRVRGALVGGHYRDRRPGLECVRGDILRVFCFAIIDGFKGQTAQEFSDEKWWPERVFALGDERSLAVLAGWPAPALMGWRQGEYVEYGVMGRTRVLSNAGMPGMPVEDPELFPLRPTWPGFLINTLFYATVMRLLVAALTMRSRIRAWRGQCVRCGYPRGESGTCSECGAAVKPLIATARTVE